MTQLFGNILDFAVTDKDMHIHTSACMYTFTYTHTHTIIHIRTQLYTDVHIFKEIKQTHTSLTQ